MTGPAVGPDDVTPARVIVANRQRLPRLAASWLARGMREAIDARGRCAIALAGGETPEPVYVELATPPLSITIDWRAVEVFFSDERAVGPEQPESNYHMAKAALLERVPIPLAQVHRMEAERADRDAAAVDYERLLPPRLDLVVLGIGEDGHTASLFPNAAALGERLRSVLPVSGPKPPPDRLTLTPRPIEEARSLVVIATGDRKANAVARAIEGRDSTSELPARLARRGVWFLDPAAAALLTTTRTFE